MQVLISILDDIVDSLSYRVLSRSLSERKEEVPKRFMQHIGYIAQLEDRVQEMDDRLKMLELDNSKDTPAEQAEEIPKPAYATISGIRRLTFNEYKPKSTTSKKKAPYVFLKTNRLVQCLVAIYVYIKL